MKCYDSWPTSMDQCYQFGDFSCISPDLTNPLVTIDLFVTTYITQTLTHICICFQTRNVREIPVGYIGTVPDSRFTCKSHPDGCGAMLSIGDFVVINTSMCTFHNATWVVPVSRINSHGRITCNIGFVKVLCDQLFLVANRIGVVTRIQTMIQPKLMLDVTHSNKKEISVGMKKTTSDLDDTVGGSHDTASSAPTKKKTGNFVTCKEFYRRMGEAVEKDESLNVQRSNTMNIVDDLMDVACVRFVDGGLPLRCDKMDARREDDPVYKYDEYDSPALKNVQPIEEGTADVDKKKKVKKATTKKTPAKEQLSKKQEKSQSKDSKKRQKPAGVPVAGDMYDNVKKFRRSCRDKAKYTDETSESEWTES